ncbi:TIGR03943 family protein [Boudabousia tangfeifanii]|uniref:TIGR03943 family protein n=1 Tax=Boudabousia tangfeifanii TaxID=1912795 RepID=A0A1D9MIX6_9ACTO|nr:TIGR03943 family protein [Boudabousia tangfeifanii]AOZ72139.1 TIGR03943 family protein [Boudabousia tangfeifanii]
MLKPELKPQAKYPVAPVKSDHHDQHQSPDNHHDHPHFEGDVRWSEATAGAIVAAVGVTLTYLALTGKINKYLLPAFKNWILLCGLILLAFAIWTLWLALRPRLGQQKTASAGTHDTGEHFHPYSKAAALMLVPVMIVALSLPAPLGAFMTSKVATAQSRAAADKPRARTALIPGQQVPGPIPDDDKPDFAAAQNDVPQFLPFPELKDGAVNALPLDELTDRVSDGDPKQLTDKTVQVVGFVSPIDQDTFPGQKGWMLSRYKIYCCAADGVIYSAIIPDGQMPKTNTWVEVTGTVDLGASKEGMPVLKVTKVKEIPEPKEPYL